MSTPTAGTQPRDTADSVSDLVAMGLLWIVPLIGALLAVLGLG
jgi:hypothetical protein